MPVSNFWFMVGAGIERLRSAISIARPKKAPGGSMATKAPLNGKLMNELAALSPRSMSRPENKLPRPIISLRPPRTTSTAVNPNPELPPEIIDFPRLLRLATDSA